MQLSRSGPLAGIRIVELAGLGPAPFAGMLLADLGAEVVQVVRPAMSNAVGLDPAHDLLNRGKASISLDLKSAEGEAQLLRLVEKADVLIEGYRPGVAEKLGIGPQVCQDRNPRLIYARMTGWGQDGPLAHEAGHDINYIALAGALGMIGRQGEKPLAPLNLVGDMGGGGMFMAFGIMAALFETARSGLGQIIDAAMIDGVALQMAGIASLMAAGHVPGARGTNLLDSGAPFYDCYETADGEYMAVGAIEPQFYAALCRVAQLDPALFAGQMDRRKWPAQKAALAEVFKARTRAEWSALFAGENACVTPVLSPAEASQHPHNAARQTYLRENGPLQPSPGPRFSRTPGAIRRPPPQPGQDTLEIMKSWGVD